ncbi:MAG: four helix bundle protein [Anaerolineae bacterium]|nr:four helix bundle protein [Anaerolineae bacterium]
MPENPISPNYRDLQVWQRGIALVKQIYLLTETFPTHEKYGLSSQIQRAAVSVPSNIAEGHARGSTPEFRRFIQISLGSLAEIDTQLEIAIQLTYIKQDNASPVIQLVIELRKMLFGLINSLPTN